MANNNEEGSGGAMVFALGQNGGRGGGQAGRQVRGGQRGGRGGRGGQGRGRSMCSLMCKKKIEI